MTEVKKRSYYILLLILLFVASPSSAQYHIYENTNIDDVSFSLEDFGTMWTFDDLPLDRFSKLYGFKPSEEWLKNVQLSALQFGGGCSAAFVSSDGLIMTNHHCGRGQLKNIQEEDENLLRDGFYAETLDEERPVPNLFVDQLIFIKDVTIEVKKAFNKGEIYDEKISNRNSKIDQLVADYEEDTGLICKVVKLYNGNKYSLYAYKRYTDIRLVMAPDFQIAATGWDWDNFTYPRYELDFMFYRAYDDDGDPVNSEHHFTWSEKGASEDEPVFVVGRPGHTDRQLSVTQLKYLRDVTYPQRLLQYNELYKIYFKLFKEYPERESELLNRVMGVGNGRKSYAGRLLGLRNPFLMKKKVDFENILTSKVAADKLLNENYGQIWDEINEAVTVLRETANEYYGYSLQRRGKSVYFTVAQKLIDYAEEMKKPENERLEKYRGEQLEITIEQIFPTKFDKELQDLLLQVHVNKLTRNLGKDNELVLKLYGKNIDSEAVNYAISHSLISTKEDVIKIANLSPDEILNSDDPFIYFIMNTQDTFADLEIKRNDANTKLDVLNEKLGEVISKVFGTIIPPDATSTLRISDGVIKGYEYNGTIAPGKTTYYGLWDRYNSFDKSTYPWGLHERWKVPPEKLDLSIPIGFASTNDIVGGNSGSSVINTKMEVVGLVHDGNLESLAGHVIFIPENNRTVATDSWGLMEALKYVYKTERLVDELKNGKIID